MSVKGDYQELFQSGPKFVKTLDVYKRTKELYLRTQLALGRIPSISVTMSNTQEGKFIYGTNSSSKIYTSK